MLDLDALASSEENISHSWVTTDLALSGSICTLQLHFSLESASFIEVTASVTPMKSNVA